MALGDYLSSLNLDPVAKQKLLASAGVDDLNLAPPTAEEMAKAGMSPEAIARTQRVNEDIPKVGLMAATSPTRVPGWTPEGEAKQMAQAARDKELAGAPPQPPQAEPGESTGPVQVSSPGQYVPAHWQPGSRSESQRATEFDPNRLASVENAQDASMGHGLIAGDKQLEAAKQMAEADVAYAKAHEEASRRAAEDLQRIEQERQRYVAEGMQKLDDLSVKAQAKVDPELAKGSAGAQVMAAIGVALGTFGSSITGGQNAALQIVQANIDRNIRAQEANIANAHKSLENEKSLYAQNLAAFGDREKAVLATKIQYLDQVKAMADQQYAKAKGVASEAQKAEFDQKLFAQQSELKMQMAKNLAVTKEVSGNEHYVPGQMVGGGAPSLGDKGKEDLYVPSLGVYARTKEEAMKLRDSSARTQNTVRELEQAKSIIAEAKQTNDPMKIRVLQKKLQGVAARAAVTATVKEGQGAMSDGDRHVSEAGLGLSDINLFEMKLPLTPSADDHMSIINSAITAHRQEYGRMGSGQQRGQEVYVKNPQTGQVEARRVLSGSNAPLRNKVDDASDLIRPPVGKSSREE